ncbi:hypothetical protein GCM10009613_05220 [Pseudonocardia kongjuensis]|uniref:NADPH-dependent FMN reductase-like domain-containing protein n=1 Tax=Pseudonocardia kongjuensis TaxID=102227 RepID=A0ABP4I697_9PSEU
MIAVLQVSVVVGNPKPRSRTARVATAVAEKLLDPGTFRITTVDLADHAHDLFRWPCTELTAINDRVAASDLVVVASPTYKATYTGLLKAFLDRYPNQGLRGVVAVPVMTGSDPRHAMGPEVHLRPLLVELGAVLPTPGLFFVTEGMDRLDTLVDEWVTDVHERLRAHLPGLRVAGVPAPSA